jgi:hypothetical protein
MASNGRLIFIQMLGWLLAVSQRVRANNLGLRYNPPPSAGPFHFQSKRSREGGLPRLVVFDEAVNFCEPGRGVRQRSRADYGKEVFVVELGWCEVGTNSQAFTLPCRKKRARSPW